MEHETLYLVRKEYMYNLGTTSKDMGIWIFRTRQAAMKYKKDKSARMKAGSGFRFTVTKAKWGPEQ